MRRALAATMAAFLLVGAAPSVFAATTGGLPPPPPPPPGCAALCSGPPPPPTPVPTVAPVEVAVQPSVDIRLADPTVSRGDEAKLAVDASTDDEVSTTVQYRKGKPKTFHSKIGSTGSLVQAWRIPKWAPLGKATVKVTVEGSGDTVSKSLTLEIVK